MISGIHFILSYTCNFECDHCFLFCGPNAGGTFTIDGIRKILDGAVELGTVESVYFEGGEPFLYYPVMVEGIRLAKERGFKTGIVTNSYWATSIEDAAIWLKPISDLGPSDLSVSDDAFHHGDSEETPAKIAMFAARSLNLSSSSICIETPSVRQTSDSDGEKGEPVVGGGAKFRGRAVEKLAENLPTRNWKTLVSCPDEDFRNPGRVHIDAYGNVHLCQGLTMGNLWKTPLPELVRNFNPDRHPVCSPILEGGPAALVRKYGIPHEGGYIDECHLCYTARLALIDRFPEYLAPRQVYGLED